MRASYFAGKPLEVGHFAWPFPRGGVRRRSELPWMRSLESSALDARSQCFVERDELLGVRDRRATDQRSACRTGSVAGGDGVMNQTRFVRVMMQSRMLSGGGSSLSTAGHAALSSARRTRRCETTAFQRGGQLQANLLLLRRRKDGDNALNRFTVASRVCGKSGKPQELPGFGRRGALWKWFPRSRISPTRITSGS